MQKIFSSPNLGLVAHLKNILENENIACLMKNFYLTGGAGELPPTECWLELWVIDETQLNDAQRLIKENQTIPATGKPWQCSNCGEQLEAQFTQCWKCGSNQPIG